MEKNNENYLELISGINTGKFIEALEEQSENPMDVNRVYDALEKLYDNGKDNEAYELVRVLYDLTGLIFPIEAETLCESEDGKNEYLSFFLMDMVSMI